MIKIEGCDQLTMELDDAQKALAALDGDLGIVKFDPQDPESIESAIKQIDSIIDDRLGAYATNLIIAPLAEQMKEHYRDEIIGQAAAARLSGDDV